MHRGRLLPVHGHPADDALLGLGFVEGVTYIETDTNLYDVTISGSKGNKAPAASADDDTSSADRQVKAKKGGKHRGKGKHRK